MCSSSSSSSFDLPPSLPGSEKFGSQGRNFVFLRGEKGTLFLLLHICVHHRNFLLGWLPLVVLLEGKSDAATVSSSFPSPPNPRYEIPTLTRSTGPLLTGTYFDYKGSFFFLSLFFGGGERKRMSYYCSRFLRALSWRFVFELRFLFFFFEGRRRRRFLIPFAPGFYDVRGWN